jgi:hypothetical protein
VHVHWVSMLDRMYRAAFYTAGQLGHAMTVSLCTVLTIVVVVAVVA